MTVSNIVRQPAYSGVHRVKTNGGKDIIEQPVPAVIEPGLQERSQQEGRAEVRITYRFGPPPDSDAESDLSMPGLKKGSWS
jgi:hypothetical protein